MEMRRKASQASRRIKWIEKNSENIHNGMDKFRNAWKGICHSVAKHRREWNSITKHQKRGKAWTNMEWCGKAWRSIEKHGKRLKTSQSVSKRGKTCGEHTSRQNQSTGRFYS